MYIGLFSEVPIDNDDTGVEISANWYERIEIGAMHLTYNSRTINDETIEFGIVTKTTAITGFCIFLNKDDVWYFASGLLANSVDAHKGRYTYILSRIYNNRIRLRSKI